MIPAAFLVVVIPLIGAALAYALRRWNSLEVIVALLTCGGVIVLLSRPIDSALTVPGLTIDIGAPLDLLGRVLRVRVSDRLPLLLLFVCAAVVFASSWRAAQGWPFVPLGLTVLSAISAGLLIRPFVYAALAFEGAAALAAIMIQAERTGERTTLGALRYLGATTLALPLFLFAGWAIDRAGSVNVNDIVAVTAAYGPAVILLIAGFGLMLGAIPLFTWVHPVAKDASPLTTAFLAAVGVGAVNFLLLEFWQAYAWLRTSSVSIAALTTGGLALLVFGGGLAWAQKSFSRVFACAILVDIGGNLLVMSNGSQLSVESLAFSILARALSLGVFGLGLWRLRELRSSDAFDDVRGVRDIWTVMALGAGGLSLAGLPGTLGFVSRWATARAYSATDAEGLVLLLLASASVGIGVLHGLIKMFSEPQPAALVADSFAGAQLSLFENFENNDVGAASGDVTDDDAAADDGLASPLLRGETLIEGEATPVGDVHDSARVMSRHVAMKEIESKLGSVSARFVVGVGVASILILGLWPGVITPLAQAVAAQYGFYR